MLENMEISLPTEEQLLNFPGLDLNRDLENTDFVNHISTNVSSLHTILLRNEEHKVPRILEQGKMVEITKKDLISSRGVIYPVLKVPFFDWILKNATLNQNGLYEFELGYYPQQNVSALEKLTMEYLLKSNTLAKDSYFYYTINNAIATHASITSRLSFSPDFLRAYEYSSLHYVIANSYIDKHKYGKWFKVAPVTWYVNLKDEILLSKRGLLVDIPYFNYDKYVPYSKSSIHNFLCFCMKRDLFQNTDFARLEKEGKKKCEPTIEDDFTYLSERLNLLRMGNPEFASQIAPIQERMEKMKQKVLK